VEPLAAGDPRQLGTYRLRGRLGAGGMGQVFLGYSPAGRAVAVKVVRRELACDPAFRTRFRREVAAARSVSGAYTASVTAAGPDDDPPWLATVFVPGPSLADAISAAGPLPAESVWKLAAGLVEALQAVHGAGLVHRDLKPANVLLAVDGPRVIDFGISHALESTAMTSTGQIVGTPSFMSPEQALGERAGQASDVFSLGCVIVFAATGAGPFGHGPLASSLYRVVHAAPTLAHLPASLRELAAACLVKKAADRPSLPALIDAIAAGRAPDGEAELASFWPVAVTSLIRSHQARLGEQLREVLAASGPGPETASLAAVLGFTTARPTVLATSPTVLATAPADMAGSPADVASSPADVPGGSPTLRGGPGAGGRPEVVTGPPLPADAVTRGVAAGRRSAAGPVSGGGPVPGVTRRGVLVGLAATGAGLAGAGWAFSRASAPQRQSSASQPPPSRKADHPVPRAGRTRGAGAGAAGPGSMRWSFATRGALAGIAVADGIVYAGSTDGTVYALRARDGGKLWEFRTGAPVQSQIVVAGGMVVAGSGDDLVYALRARDGGKLWGFRTGGSVGSGIEVADGTVFAASGDESIYALDARRGVKRWSDSVGSGRIAVAAGRVFVGSEEDTVVALRAHDGGRLWDRPTGSFGPAGMAVAGDCVYVGHGDKVTALRASTGGQVWTFTAGGLVQSGIAVTGGVVYAGDDDEVVHALRAAAGGRIWSFRADGSVNSGIAVAGGAVYFGTNGYTVHALSARDGHQLWDFAASGPVSSAMAVADGTVYVGSNDAKVYALRA
jgi:outer membrane protein assembly factor BamB